MRARVARSRELVARGFAAAAVARVMQITRQAIYRTPTPRTPPQRRPVRDPVEQVIVEVARDNQTDGYRMVTAFVRRRLGRPVHRKRVLRVMRERKLVAAVAAVDELDVPPRSRVVRNPSNDTLQLGNRVAGCELNERAEGYAAIGRTSRARAG